LVIRKNGIQCATFELSGSLRKEKPTAAEAGWVLKRKERLLFWLAALDAASPLSDYRP